MDDGTDFDRLGGPSEHSDDDAPPSEATYYAAGLRRLADFIEAHPELALPSIHNGASLGVTATFHCNDSDPSARAALAALEPLFTTDGWRATDVGTFTSLEAEVPWGTAKVFVSNHPTDRRLSMQPVRDWHELAPKEGER